MQGPNLSWGDPVGTYEIEILPNGAVLYYRAAQPNGGPLLVAIPLTFKALAEMQGLLNLLAFSAEHQPQDIPHGKIAIH